MTHLQTDELAEAVDGVLSIEGQQHLAECAECRDQVTYYSALVAELQTVAVPEPSPLFWTHFSDRVRRAIEGEPVPARTARWFEWPVLVPVGALAAIVLALTLAVPQGAYEVWQMQLAMNGAAGEPTAESADVDVPWELVAALVENAEFDPTEQGVATPPGSAERAVSQLTAAERQELIRLLREEVRDDGLENGLRRLREDLKGTGG